MPAGIHASSEQLKLLGDLLANRGICSSDALDLSLRRLLPPNALGGMDKAVQLLVDALAERKKILVVGDYDADGATSTALACHALRTMGAAWIHYLVPDRFKLGYGLTAALAVEAAKLKPDLLITVDNGISSIEGVRQAKALGMQVLITDHHLPGPTLPEADAIVNPNLDDDPFPSKHLAGVGVIFYLMSALRARLRKDGWFETHGSEPNMGDYLDLVAFGTVADVVRLDTNNRVLVEQGLRRIRAGKVRPGIQALIEVAGREPSQLVAADFGFGLGPRLNAAGRLDNMSIGIECLLASEYEAARNMAVQLDDLNRQRREIEQDMRDEAFADLERLGFDQQPLPAGLCVFQEHWHEGVIGILASRIKERWFRPTIVFATAEDGELKGSARSLPGLHIRDLLESINSQNPGMIKRFGGHAMAAGLTLAADAYEDFKAAFEQAADAQLDESQLQGRIDSDGELPSAAFDIGFARLLKNLIPWGQGCPSPIFDGEFGVLSRRTVGDGRHLKMIVEPKGSGHKLDAICFGYDAELPAQNAYVRLAYELDVNSFRGETKLQLLVRHVAL